MEEENSHRCHLYPNDIQNDENLCNCCFEGRSVYLCPDCHHFFCIDCFNFLHKEYNENPNRTEIPDLFDKMNKNILEFENELIVLNERFKNIINEEESRLLEIQNLNNLLYCFVEKNQRREILKIFHEMKKIIDTRDEKMQSFVHEFAKRNWVDDDPSNKF
eukprot:gene2132-1998_t